MDTSEGVIERVTMVYYYKNRVSVRRLVPNLSAQEERTLEKCSDAPREQFKNAFVALIPLALKIAGISDKRWLGNAIVSQVTINRDSKGRRNFVLTVIRPMEHGAVVFNTPMRMERNDESETGPQFATDDLTSTIDRVCVEALVYVNGERTQLSLDLGPPPAAEEQSTNGDGAEHEEQQPDSSAPKNRLARKATKGRRLAKKR